MKKIIFLTFVTLVVVAVGAYLWILLQPTRSELEIQAVPGKVSVYLNGKKVGQTPYLNTNLKPGHYQLKLVNNQGENWQRDLDIPSHSKVFLRREFFQQGSRGRLLYLTPNGKNSSEAFFTSLPLKASVSVDGSMRGYTPLALQLKPGRHHLIFSHPDQAPVELEIKTVSGYRLIVNVDFPPAQASPSPSPQPKPTIAATKVIIQETPTGWLRVRNQPSRHGKEIGRVLPGKTYPYQGEKNGWFKIEYQAGKSGWVSGRYAKRRNQ